MVTTSSASCEGLEANHVVVVTGVYKVYYITDAPSYTTEWFIDVSLFTVFIGDSILLV